MKCIRCNKEFEGEGNLCEDCKKKVELEQATAQTTSEKKVNPFKKFYSNNVKTYLTQKEKVKNLSIIIGMIIIILIAVICVKNNGKKSNITSKIGNIREYGYADEQNGWIYYIAPDSELSKMGIYRTRGNGSGKQEEVNIIGTGDIMSLNVFKNYIYFIVQETSAYSNEGDTLNNKIYRMKIDGSELEVINDNEFHNNCESIYVLDNSVYYVGTDAKLHKMGLNGKNKKAVSDEVFAVTKPYNNYIVTDDFIIYNKEDNSESSPTYTTMIMNSDGKGMKAVIEDEYLSYMDMDDSYIYFTDVDNVLCRTKINSGKKEELYSTRKVYHLNVKDDYAYFYSYTDNNEVALYRINLKSTDKGAQAIKVLNNTTPCLNIVSNRLYFTDRDDTGGFVIKLLNTKKLEESTIIYSYQYTDTEDDDTALLKELSDNEEKSEDETEETVDEAIEETSSENATDNTVEGTDNTNQ